MVLYAYLSERREDCRERVYVLADRLLDALAEQESEFNLFGGCIGVGWTFAHLQNEFPSLGLNIDLAELDDLVVQVLADRADELRYDLISGLVGLGVYGLERGVAGRARDVVACVVKCLEDRAEKSGECVTWRTPVGHLALDSRALNPRGLYDVGVAHGIPGILAFLASAKESGVIRRGTTTLLAEATLSLLRMCEIAGVVEMPYIISETEAPRLSRMAWCYGSPGVSTALLRVAKAIGREDIRSTAIEMANRSASTPTSISGVRDAGLCHGATGVAHLFNRAASFEPQFIAGRSASLKWLEHALAMRVRHGGIGGFFSLKAESGLVASPGFLEGAAGVALALEAAVSQRDPAWDRVLLMSSPPERKSE
ncbi:MAG: lanthionine synthetase C family protein [Gemmatimonadaceae bacterium]|nr:lanthionine synthetase C family protein [Gemmatimonadaceae bacterium]